ncbi:hypothetical protein HC891_04955 [Candidatus Gracilibacteria bacterium]|nr:hypothetical protein [Candidatus Gracilibacteria bacterium]
MSTIKMACAFLTILRALFVVVRPMCCRKRCRFWRREPPPLYVILQALLVDMSALPHGLKLVLDDYHLVDTDAIHQAVAYLLRHLPTHCQVVLISRVDPPLPQARLRAERALIEVRAMDLRFNLEETSALVSRLQPVADNALVTSLHQQTEGWAIALQLVALAQINGITAGSGFAVASRQIAEYLAAEVFAQQPPSVQQLLLTLAVPERFCAELAAALLAAPEQLYSAEHQIEQLMRASQLVLPLDSEGRWYRFHHLFRDLLLRRLRLTVGEAGIRQLQLRAATWLSDAGHIEEAVRLFLAVGDEDTAAAVIERQIVGAMEQGAHNSSMANWMRLLPDSVVERRLGLTLIAARLASLSLNMTALQSHLTRLAMLLDDDYATCPPLPWPRFTGDRAALAGTMYFWQGDASRAFVQLQRALEQGTAVLPMGQVFLYLGLAYVGEDRYAEGCAQMALAAHQPDASIDRVNDHYHRYTSLCGMHLMAGNLDDLARDARLLSEHVTASGLGAATATYADYCLALVAYERNDLLSATAHFNALIKLKYQVNATTYIAGVIGIALTLVAQGANDEAAHYIAEATTFANETGGAFLRHQALGSALRLALAQGDLAAALQAAAAIAPDIHLGSSLWVETPRLSQARALIAVGDDAALASAELVIAACLSELEMLHHQRLKIATLALRAVLYQGQGRHIDALLTLEQALIQAEPHGFVRSFVDCGPALQPLLHTLAERRVLVAYVQRILKAYYPVDAWPELPGLSPPLPEMLTRREREILALLAERWSNQEIAERLVVTVNTVRKHTSTIYDKLGVSSRREAVTTARGLGLLPSIGYWRVSCYPVQKELLISCDAHLSRHG